MRKERSRARNLLLIAFIYGLALILILCITSCQTRHLKEDFAKSPLDTNYLSAEIYANGRLYVGVSSVVTTYGQPFAFSVAGIHSGTITARSDSCGFYVSQTYQNSEVLNFELPMSLHVEENMNACLINILIFPKFSESEAGQVKWRAITGAISVLFSDRPSITLSSRLNPHEKPRILLRAPEGGARFFADGCGTRVDKRLMQGTHIYSFDLSHRHKALCAIDGFLKGFGPSDTHDDAIWLLIDTYDDTYKRLPAPSIIWRRNGRTFDVVADSAVGFLSFQGTSRFSNEATFAYDEALVTSIGLHDDARGKMLRGYTSQGRLLVCEVNKGEELLCFH